MIEEDVSVANQPTSVTQFALGWTGTGGPSPGTSTADVNWRVWGNLDGNGSLTSRFLNGAAANQVFAEMSGGNIDWLLADYQNSNRDVVDNNGNLLDTLAYDPFGNVTSQSTPANQPSLGYAGYQFDVATGFYRTAGREYDAVAGRWMSQDPLSFQAGDGNLYRYVKNSPTDATDPSGYDPLPVYGSACAPSRASMVSPSRRRAVMTPAPPPRHSLGLGSLRRSDVNWNRGWFPEAEDIEAYLQYYDPTWGLEPVPMPGVWDHSGRPVTTNEKSAYRKVWETQHFAQVERVAGYFQSRYDQARAEWRQRNPEHAGSYEQFFGERPNLPREHSAWDYVPVAGSMRDLVYNIKNRTYGQAFIAAVMLGDELLLVTRVATGAFRVVRVALSRASEAATLRTGRAALSRRTAEAILAGRGPARVSLETLGQTSCFVAGTPLLTPEGDKRVEKFRVGDRILSRPESNCEAPVEVKVVEETFVRVSPVLRLQAGGRTIGTTAEHLFFVKDKGWMFAKELKPGDQLSSDDGRWLAVEAVSPPGEVAEVYNLRVSDYHTYFVGSREWGFSVWAHNTCYEIRRLANGQFGLFEQATGNAVTRNGVAIVGSDAAAVRRAGLLVPEIRAAGIAEGVARTPLTPSIARDASGRITESSATIRPENLYSGTGTTDAARALTTPDDAGHIIGRLLGGGGGATSNNIFAQLPAVNRGAFRTHEAWVAAQVRAGKSVQVRVELIYPNATATRPTTIRYHTTVDGVTTITNFPN